MKRCPQCNRVETDDVLAFCRVDGTRLIIESDAEVATRILPDSFSPESQRTKLLRHDESATATTHSLGTPPESLSPRPLAAAHFVNGIKRHKAAVVFVSTLIVLGCAGLAYVVYRLAFQSTPHVAHFQKMKITRVTTEGNVESATISPDGKYIAYSLDESGRRSLWTKHLGTGSRVQIVPTSEAFAINASNFSADGGYVYYTRVDEENPQGALYQVPVLGGRSKKILANVVQPVYLSPNGKQIAFGRYHLKGAEDELLVAESDGSNERRVITVKEPNWLAGSTPVWSPDGKWLAVAYGSEDRNELTGKNLGMTIALVSLANGELKQTTPPRWLYVSNVAWFNDGSGLVFIAREQARGPRQIWQISYPDGEAQRITNDLNSYASYSLTLTSDGKALIAVQSDPVSNIWITPVTDPGNARSVTPRKNALEGRRFGVVSRWKSPLRLEHKHQGQHLEYNCEWRRG